MIDTFRYWLSANLMELSLWLIPHEPVRLIMTASLMRGAMEIEEGMGSD